MSRARLEQVVEAAGHHVALLYRIECDDAVALQAPHALEAGRGGPVRAARKLGDGEIE